MSVSRLSKEGDWTFGQQLAGYIRGSEEVLQNVETRIKSFKRDWFLDQNAEVDWFNILSNKNTQATAERQIARAVVNTNGVASLDKLNLTIDRENRKSSVSLSYTDIYKNVQELVTEVS